MIINEEKEIKRRVEELTGRVIYGTPIIKEDTTQYMSIAGGMILRLAGNDYFVTGDATEGRFGIEDQPKFWVKYAYDLETGKKKIIKLVFHEDFTSRIGPFLIRGRRSPQKEAQVLEVVEEHPNFMQGKRVLDIAGNLVRIIDYVRGPSMYSFLKKLEIPHEQYYYEVLPGTIEKIMEAFEAIDFLNRSGLHHGDIRNDHIIIDAETGNYVWIDFDYEISHSDYDIWCLGNVLTYIVGKGSHTFVGVRTEPDKYQIDTSKVKFEPDDAMFFFRHRISNLKKLFPYIPDKLNDILLNFSAGTSFFYEDVKSLIDNIRSVF